MPRDFYFLFSILIFHFPFKVLFHFESMGYIFILFCNWALWFIAKNKKKNRTQNKKYADTITDTFCLLFCVFFIALYFIFLINLTFVIITMKWKRAYRITFLNHFNKPEKRDSFKYYHPMPTNKKRQIGEILNRKRLLIFGLKLKWPQVSFVKNDNERKFIRSLDSTLHNKHQRQ